MKKRFVLGIACAAIGIVAACGGNVVIDDGTASSSGMGGGGLGGASSTMVGVGAGGVGGASCGGNLGANVIECGGGAATGPGGVFCQFNFCDKVSGRTWMATCQGNTCQCQQIISGGGPACMCTLPGGTDACTTQTNCCYTTH
jgi:hypothetical protein